MMPLDLHTLPVGGKGNAVSPCYVLTLPLGVTCRLAALAPQELARNAHRGPQLMQSE